MNILLSEEQIIEIMGMQEELDKSIMKKHNIEGQDLSLEKHLALKTELFEFANEIESFKYWKKNKGKNSILEEACDVLHFVLSIAIDNDEKLEFLELPFGYDKEEYDMNELIGLLDAISLDCFINKDYSDLSGFVMLLCIALDKCEFNADDLYKAYIRKNKVNHDRQCNNY